MNFIDHTFRIDDLKHQKDPFPNARSGRTTNILEIQEEEPVVRAIAEDVDGVRPREIIY